MKERGLVEMKEGGMGAVGVRVRGGKEMKEGWYCCSEREKG